MAIMSGLFTLGRDAELKTTSSGTSVCELALAYDYEQAAAVWQPPSVVNRSLFREVVVSLPEDAAAFLPSLSGSAD